LEEKMNTVNTDNAVIKTELIRFENKPDSLKETMMGKITYNNGNHLNVVFCNHKEFSDDDSLISMIFDQSGQELWRHKKIEGQKTRISKLIFHEEIKEHVIISERWGIIYKVIPTLDLMKDKVRESTEIALFVGGRKLADLIYIKKSIARQLGMRYVFSDDEKKYLTAQQKLKTKRMEAEQKLALEKKQEEYKEKIRNKKGRLSNLISREEIKVMGPNGEKLWGIPVVETEWEVLPVDTKVIGVERYEKDMGLEDMKPFEAFVTGKTVSGKCVKKRLTVAMLPKLKAIKEPMVKVLGVLIFEIDGKSEEVQLFSQNGLDVLRKNGLNNGTIVAIGAQEDKEFEVMKLEGNECQRIGSLSPEAEVYFTL